MDCVIIRKVFLSTMAVKSNTQDFFVRVSCMTFNQSNYIIDALNGFVMQQTNFPFVCTVVDDASTDGEQEVIKNYMQEHFDLQDSSVAYEKDTDYGHVTFAQHKTNKNCYFAVIYLKENHYSQKKSKAPYLTEWMDTKYIALCEGDDYWTDPLKLQKQVGFLEEHEEYCMTACAFCWVKNGKIIKKHNISDLPRELTTEEVIKGGGGYLATGSLVYDNERLNGMIPKWRKDANVGDYPLQIQGTIAGKLWCFSEYMCVYRFDAEGSWSSMYWKKGLEFRLGFLLKEAEWMRELDVETDKKYQKAIHEHLLPQLHVLFLFGKISGKEYLHSVFVVGGRKNYYLMMKGFKKRLVAFLRQRVIE